MSNGDVMIIHKDINVKVDLSNCATKADLKMQQALILLN